VADASGVRLQQQRTTEGVEIQGQLAEREGEHQRPEQVREIQRGPEGLGEADRDEHTRPTNGFWRDVDWLFCRDGKWRPVRPGTFPLAHGAPARVVRLRGYGNAINAEVARMFIESYLYPAESE
jgi:DNA (cytosine-5)-methyltransferase 1